jgi:NAD+ synthase (glutamine-hydrolysing)
VNLRLALAQINPTVGDLDGNASRIVAFSRQAREKGADLVLFPEMALTGYPPEDLLFEPLFLAKTGKSLRALLRSVPKDIVVVVGSPTKKGHALYNGAFVLYGGRFRQSFHKWFLPNYGVFDEQRYFPKAKNRRCWTSTALESDSPSVKMFGDPKARRSRPPNRALPSFSTCPPVPTTRAK